MCPVCGSMDVEKDVKLGDMKHSNIFGSMKTTYTCNNCKNSEESYPLSGLQF
jgi:predicted nucleic-acid-binding Zn-ribbon protein